VIDDLWLRARIYSHPQSKIGSSSKVGRTSSLIVVGITSFVFGISAANLFQPSAGPRIVLDGKNEIHYAPEESLEPLDVSLIDGAEHAIDVAAYVLTDVPIIEALMRAADRGVKVRAYLYDDQIPTRGKPAAALDELMQTPTVDVRIKSAKQPLMHLKAYQIDGRVLRTGSANLSASGEKQQDNDMFVIKDPKAAEGLRAKFEAMWTRGANSEAAK
jgi:phosphatidylserine/phosphatidylglycerophosphate/cardiolipin synthase-like enzyme